MRYFATRDEAFRTTQRLFAERDAITRKVEVAYDASGKCIGTKMTAEFAAADAAWRDAVEASHAQARRARETFHTAARADLASLPANSAAAISKRHRDGENMEAMLLAMPRLYDDNGERL